MADYWLHCLFISTFLSGQAGRQRGGRAGLSVNLYLLSFGGLLSLLIGNQQVWNIPSICFSSLKASFKPFLSGVLTRKLFIIFFKSIKLDLNKTLEKLSEIHKICTRIIRNITLMFLNIFELNLLLLLYLMK